MIMKNDDLERLEESHEVQRLIRSAKKQYEQEKVEYSPVSFSSVMESIREKQRQKKKLRISPWWLTAACLLGWIIGYGFSGGQALQPDNRLAITDTVIIVHEKIDTVYQKVEPQPMKTLIATHNVEKTVPSKKAATQNEKTTKQPAPVLISPEFLQPQMSMPDPESDCYAANGMTVAEDNYPIHLLMTVQSK